MLCFLPDARKIAAYIPPSAMQGAFSTRPGAFRGVSSNPHPPTSASQPALGAQRRKTGGVQERPRPGGPKPSFFKCNGHLSGVEAVAAVVHLHLASRSCS